MHCLAKLKLLLAIHPCHELRGFDFMLLSGRRRPRQSQTNTYLGAIRLPLYARRSGVNPTNRPLPISRCLSAMQRLAELCVSSPPVRGKYRPILAADPLTGPVLPQLSGILDPVCGQIFGDVWTSTPLLRVPSQGQNGSNGLSTVSIRSQSGAVADSASKRNSVGRAIPACRR